MKPIQTLEQRAEALRLLTDRMKSDILEQRLIASQNGQPDDFCTGFAYGVKIVMERILNTVPSACMTIARGGDPLVQWITNCEIFVSIYETSCKLAGVAPLQTPEAQREFLLNFTETMIAIRAIAQVGRNNGIEM